MNFYYYRTHGGCIAELPQGMLHYLSFTVININISNTQAKCMAMITIDEYLARKCARYSTFVSLWSKRYRPLIDT